MRALAGTESRETRRRALLAEHAVDQAPLTEVERRRIKESLDGHSNIEIAASEGVSEAAVRKSLRRAAEKTRSWVDQNVG